MNIQFSNKINYEIEAVKLIDLHYGKEAGCQNWLDSALKKSSLHSDWLSDCMRSLIEIENDVFRTASISEADFKLYFEDPDSDLDSVGLSMADIFCEINCFYDGTDENELKKFFCNFVLTDFPYQPLSAAPDAETFYRLLRAEQINAEKKWICFEIYCNLTEHINRIQALLKPVIAALKKHEAALQRLIDENLPDAGHPCYLQENNQFAKTDFETIVVDYSVFGFNRLVLRNLDCCPDTGYLHYGIYVDRFFKEKHQQDSSGEQLANQMKTLSDKSRLKILCLLKEREMFGQELKDALNLSNATISHHMNELMVDNFVSVRKDGSKVLYSLNPDKIEAALNGIRQLLLS